MNDDNRQLNNGDMHLLRLVQKGRDAQGWAKVSKMLWPIVQGLPSELVELRPSEDGGHMKLTEAGETVLAWS